MMAHSRATRLDSATVKRLLSLCRVTFFVHRVRGTKRCRHEADSATALGKRVAERLAESGVRTGGFKAFDLEQVYEHV